MKPPSHAEAREIEEQLAQAKRSGFISAVGALHNAMPDGFVELDSDKIIGRVADRVRELTMQRDVMCEKLNEYIDKTKAAELRAQEAERECERLKDALVHLQEQDDHYQADIEQARAEGYERGRAELGELEAWLRSHPWRDAKLCLTTGGIEVKLWSLRPEYSDDLAVGIKKALTTFAAEQQEAKDPTR